MNTYSIMTKKENNKLSVNYLNKIIHGDCLEILKYIPSETVNLCVIDPPYFKVKNHYWDNQWNNSILYIEWMNEVFNEIHRILTKSGSIYVFCYPKMAFEIEGILRNKFNCYLI